MFHWLGGVCKGSQCIQGILWSALYWQYHFNFNELTEMHVTDEVPFSYLVDFVHRIQ